MKKIALFLLCFCIVVLILSVGCVSSTKADSPGSVPSKTFVQPTQASTPVKTVSKENLELIESHLEPDQYGVNNYLVGTVKNNAGKTYSNVEITINFYDKSGAQIASTRSGVKSLDPGGVMNFKVWVGNTTSYKIKEITGV
jgi:uncharacterized protein YcfL